MRRIVKFMVGTGMITAVIMAGCSKTTNVVKTTAASELSSEAMETTESETKATDTKESQGKDADNKNDTDKDESDKEKDGKDKSDKKMKDDLEWIGNYQARDGKSITVMGANDNVVTLTIVSYSEDGWGEKDYKLNIDSSDANKAILDPKYGLKGVEFTLTDEGIKVDADLFMADMYYRMEGFTDASVNAEHILNAETSYEVAGITLPDETVENYAKDLRIEILHDDYESIVEKARYPFKIDDNYYNDESSLLNRLQRYGFPESFKAKVAEEDCRDMFVNVQGVMMSDGEVWFGPDSDGLSIISFNFKTVATGSELEANENLSKVDVYDYYLSTLTSGTYYTEIDTGLDHPLLLVTEKIESDNTAKKANVCYPIGNLIYLVGVIESPYENYPIRFDGSGLYCTSDHYVLKYNFDVDTQRVVAVSGVEDNTMVADAPEGTYYSVNDGVTAEITEAEFKNYIESVQSTSVVLFNEAG